MWVCMCYNIPYFHSFVYKDLKKKQDRNREMEFHLRGDEASSSHYTLGLCASPVQFGAGQIPILSHLRLISRKSL